MKIKTKKKKRETNTIKANIRMCMPFEWIFLFLLQFSFVSFDEFDSYTHTRTPITRFTTLSMQVCSTQPVDEKMLAIDSKWPNRRCCRMPIQPKPKPKSKTSESGFLHHNYKNSCLCIFYLFIRKRDPMRLHIAQYPSPLRNLSAILWISYECT